MGHFAIYCQQILQDLFFLFFVVLSTFLGGILSFCGGFGLWFGLRFGLGFGARFFWGVVLGVSVVVSIGVWA